MSIAGSVMGAGETLKAGSAQYIESRRAAVMARIAGRQRAGEIRDEGEAFAGQQKAGFAKSGVLIDSGSPLLAVMDTVAKVERNALRAEAQGEEQGRALSIQGKTQYESAKSAAMSTVIGGAGSALTMYGKASADAFKPSSPAEPAWMKGYGND